MKKSAFTICAKNYIGLALILEKSLKSHNPDIDFFIFVADELEANYSYPVNVIMAKSVINVNEETWINMSFKYNLTEFCTSIKPSCFKHLLSLGYEKICFFDPDILVYDNLNYIYDKLSSYSIMVTPHLLDINANRNREMTDISIKSTGLFNLGFLGISNTETTSKVMNWWESKLKNECFDNLSKLQFTDQKWMDFLPLYVDQKELFICRNLGMNLAPWNFHERKITTTLARGKEKYFVSYRQSKSDCNNELLFVHYSGYNYMDMLNGKTTHKYFNQLPDYKDISTLIETYKSFIIDNKNIFTEYLGQKYTYGTFDNGAVINGLNRKFYNEVENKGYKVNNPFSSQESFFSALNKTKMISNELSGINKINKRSVKNFDTKLKRVNLVFKILYKIIGRKRYFLLLKFFSFFSRHENHAFLIEKKLK